MHVRGCLVVCVGTALAAGACDDSPELPNWGGTTLLASDEAAPTTPAANGSSLFWFVGDGTTEEIRALPIGGGAPLTLATVAVGVDISPQSLVADAESVYFRDRAIRRLPVAGGDPVALEPSEGPQAETYLALDATHVYWVNKTSGEVGRVAKAGGAAELLATSSAGVVGGIALDDAEVYWAAGSGVLRVPLSGGADSVVGGTPTQPFVAVDVDDVYFLDVAEIEVAKKDGSVASASLASLATANGSQVVVDGLTIDRDFLYVTSSSQRVIHHGHTALFSQVARVAKVDGVITILAEGPGRVRGLAIDAAFVYFTVSEDAEAGIQPRGQVRAVDK